MQKVNMDLLNESQNSLVISYDLNVSSYPFWSYLACKYEAKENCDCKLTVTKEDDVQQIWIRRMLQEEPSK